MRVVTACPHPKIPGVECTLVAIDWIKKDHCQLKRTAENPCPARYIYSLSTNEAKSFAVGLEENRGIFTMFCHPRLPSIFIYFCVFVIAR